MNTEQEIDALIHTIDGGRVLDVGTGGGTMLAWLATDLKSYEAMVGVDVHTLDAAALDDDHIFNRPNVEYQQMDAHELAFPDASFDTVTMLHSLHHMVDVKQVLAQMWRVLKPGGRLIVQEMYQDNLNEAQQTHKLLHHWWAATDRAHGITHNETFMRAELTALIEELGPRHLTLFDYADLERDPHDPNTIASLKNRLAQYVARLDDLLEHGDGLRAQAAELEQRLDTVGFCGATVLIAFAEK